ncbi:MAG TPA: hypothetical protein DG753_07085 [Clostridium sp.]|nr:hypothetical protein [Clostridium sp.]
MNKRFKKKIFIKYLSIFIVAITIISVLRFSPYAIKAEDYKDAPSFDFSISKNTETDFVDDEMIVDGVITPKPFMKNIIQKKVVLVLDISESMAEPKNSTDTRIAKLKLATKEFLEKIKNKDNIQVAIIAYSADTFINPTFKIGENGKYEIGEIYKDDKDKKKKVEYYECYENKKFLNTMCKNEGNSNGEYEELVKIVDGLKTSTGTNIGEGLRKAAYMLNKDTDNDCDKTIIFMTDGVPGYYPGKTKGKGAVLYEAIDNNTIRSESNEPHLGGSGGVSDLTSTSHKDNIEKCKTNTVKVGNIIRDKIHANIYSIGYELDDTTVDGKKHYEKGIFEEIHNSMTDLTRKNEIRYATTNTIKELFSDIANRVQNTFISDNLDVSFDFPQDKIKIEDVRYFDINGKELDKNDVKITYTGIESQDNRSYIYNADPIKFSMKVKGTKVGLQSITASVDINFTELSYKKNKKSTLELSFHDKVPCIKADLTSNKNVNAIPSENINIEYTLHPEKFMLNDGSTSNDSYDEDNDKDIAFLVDSTLSNGVAQPIINKILSDDYFKNKNTRYTIISYGNNDFKRYKLDDYMNESEISNAATAIKNDSNSKYDNNCQYVSAVKTLITKLELKPCDKVSIKPALDEIKEVFNNGRNEVFTKDIDSDRGKTNKNIVIISNKSIEDLDSIEKLPDNYKVITFNSRYLATGKTNPDNNIKQMHYKLTDKEEKNELIEEMNDYYYINVNYDNYNENNSVKFFNDDNNLNSKANAIENVIMGKIDTNLKDKMQASSNNTKTYTVYPKLKFNLGGNFDVVSGLNSTNSDDSSYETESIPVTYTLNNDGYYYPDKEKQKVSFVVKPESNLLGHIRFGSPNDIIYTGIFNQTMKYELETPNIFVLEAGEIKHGFYDGNIKNGEPEIDENTADKVLVTGSNRKLAATFTAYKNTIAKLDIGKLPVVENSVHAHVLDSEGNYLIDLDTSKSGNIYTINFDKLTESKMKILVEYTVKVPDKKGTFTSTISYLDKSASAYINTNGGENYLPELF